MKTIYHFTAPLLALITMAACAELEVSENTQNSNNELLQELSITGKDFKFDDETRSSVNIGESGASFTWDEDDVIGIFPDKGDQVSFAMDKGAGTQTATFSGGGWALKSSAKYAAYYPHVYENRDLTKIPVSYVGQTQNGNGNTDHIGAFDFMAAGVSTPENGAVAFDLQHLGALVQLTINIPEPSTLTNVVLTSSTEFAEAGTIDLTDDTPAITTVTQSKTFEIALNNVATTEANENVIVYFMTAPIDLTDSELTAAVHFAEETIHEVEISGKNLKAGKAYKLAEKADKNIDYIDEYGINQGKGIEIDGIVWAPVNCGYHSIDFKYGKLYQWGRKYGQGYSGSYINIHGISEGEICDATTPELSENRVSEVNGNHKNNANIFYIGFSDWVETRNDNLWNSGSESSPAKTEADPCPDGWRVPTYDELSKLFLNCSYWTANDTGQPGTWFSGSVSYKENVPQVFFPAGGVRFNTTGIANVRGGNGYYWSSKPDTTYGASHYLVFGVNSNSKLTSTDRANGYSVRCVHE